MYLGSVERVEHRHFDLKLFMNIWQHAPEIENLKEFFKIKMKGFIPKCVKIRKNISYRKKR